MKTKFLLLVSLILCAGAVFAQRDMGAFRKPIPNTDRPELRWVDEALYNSGFLFNEKVRQAYFDMCLEQVVPQLHFNEITWEWLMANPEVLNATFALQYPPNPNIIHNFVKLAKLVGPEYALKYKQLLIAFAVANRDRRILMRRTDSGGNTPALDRYGFPIETEHPYGKYEFGARDRYGNVIIRNLAYDPKTKGNLEKGLLQQHGWYLNHDVKVPGDAEFAADSNGVLFEDEAERKQRLIAMHGQFDLGGNELAKSVADWLKRNKQTKMYEIMSLTKQAFQNKTGLRVSSEEEIKGLPWDKIAHVAGRYPPRSSATLVETLCMRIQRYEEVGAEKSKLFPLSKAPWPLLLLLTQLDPADEASYWWNMYRTKGSVPGYATYSFDYEKPEFRYNDGDWDPNATPRILTDGGVCGRLSTMAEFAQRSIGTPAQGMGQPGHRAFMTYDYHDGKYSATMHHSVNTIDVSTVGWHLPPLWGTTYDPHTKLFGFGPMTGENSTGEERNNIRNHIGLCEAMNRGLANWEDSRMATFLYDIYEAAGASQEQKEALLRSAFLLNVANTDVVYRIAALRKGNARQTEKLRDAFRKGFVDTAAGCTGDKPIRADQDLSALLRSNTVGQRNSKKVTNEWALFVLNAIFEGTYANIPNEFDPYYVENRMQWITDKNEYAKVVAEELKYQKKLGNSPFLQKVQRMNDKYDEVRLAGNIDRRVNLKEAREREEFEKNCW